MTWTKGKSGNPNGRPKGHKDKFSNKFWADVLHDWTHNGAQVIADVRANNPTAYFRTMASILPQDEQARELRHSIEVTLREPDWLRLGDTQSEDIKPQVIDMIDDNDDGSKP